MFILNLPKCTSSDVPQENPKERWLKTAKEKPGEVASFLFPSAYFWFLDTGKNPVKPYAQMGLRLPAGWGQPTIEASFKAASRCFVFLIFTKKDFSHDSEKPCIWLPS